MRLWNKYARKQSGNDFSQIWVLSTHTHIQVHAIKWEHLNHEICSRFQKLLRRWTGIKMNNKSKGMKRQQHRWWRDKDKSTRWRDRKRARKKSISQNDERMNEHLLEAQRVLHIWMEYSVIICLKSCCRFCCWCCCLFSAVLGTAACDVCDILIC